MSNLSNTLIILSPAFPANESETVWVRPKQLFVRKLKEVCPSLEIIVLSFNYPLHAEQYTWKKVLVVAFNGMHTRKLRRLLLWWRVWKKLRSIKKEKSIVGILSFWCGECALVGSYFARIHKLKHFIWISGMDAKKTNKLIRFIKPREDKLVAMSVFLQNEFAKNHSITPKYIIPIGVDPTEFEDIPRSRDIDILGVGTLNPFKQYDALITLVKTLSSRFPQIKAVIIGEGTEREKLEQLVKELDLEANVTFTGLMTHTATLACMQRAKILIHPSAYEGFGSVCIEALFAGAHVISFF